VRAQRYDDPTALAHFRMFALCTAGRARGDWAFEVDGLLAHLRVPLDGAPPADALETRVLDPLRRAFPFVTAALDPDRAGGRAYYTRLCFDVTVTARDGRRTSIGDGGFTGWAAAMLGDRKERLLVSAIGNERTHQALGPDA
jgi:hypothetical protein